MPMQLITKKNLSEHTKKVIVKKKFRHAGRVLEIGEVVVLSDYALYDVLERKLAEIYTEPAPVILNDSESHPVILNDSEESPKKVRTRKKKAK